MAAAKKKPSSLADNPPVELYGPEDGGWYTTRVYDWIALCPCLRDPDVRGYLILRSLVIEKYKNPVRKLTLLDLCELIPSPTPGQPSSLTRVRGILDALSKVGLISTPEGGPVKTSSRASAAGKAIRIRVNDLPPDGYAGWRNTEDKLSHLARVRAESAGRKCDPVPGGGPEEEQPGRKSDPVGRKCDPRGLESDPDSQDDQPEREVPLDSSFGTGPDGDALAARSAVDVRRTSTTGSSPDDVEGGFAASSNDHPSPTTETPPSAGSQAAARHSKQQLDLVRAVRIFFPADLLNGWTNPTSGQVIPSLPDIPALSQAILDALDGDVPAADRTVEQLGARIVQRWNHHGWGEKYYRCEISSLVGAAIAMVRPLKASDRYGCANPRCEAGKDADTGVDCHVCPKRLEDRRAARKESQEGHVPAPRPASATRAPFRECACRNPIPKGSDDTMCRGCRRKADGGQLVGIQGPAPF